MTNKDFGEVGNIRIRKETPKKNKKDKKNTTPIGVKIFVWFMFIAMCASFFVSLIFYFVQYAIQG